MPRANRNSRPRPLTATAVAAAAVAGLAGAGRPAAAATVVASYNADATVGQDAATGTSEFAAEFVTGTTTATALSASLLLQEVSTGSSTLYLYSDTPTTNSSGGGLVPNALLATFTSPTAYNTSGLSAVTYNLSSYTLAANTDYWLVLKANSGEFDWAYTQDVTDNTADSTDGGTTFFGQPDGFAYQFNATTGTATVPEPAAATALAALTSAGGLLTRRSRRR